MNIPHEFEWMKHRMQQRDKALQNRQERIKKIQALLEDPAATDGEKQAARAALERLTRTQTVS